MLSSKLINREPSPSLETGLKTIQHKKFSRFVVVFAIIAMLEVLMFRHYFDGTTIPPWDFLGSYNTDAFLWWGTGSFFNPPSWIPNFWAGYPSALVLQNSAWYLPVGIASAFGSYNLHSAAVLAALHVGFGALGTFALARSLGLGFRASLFGLVAAFFGVGYYSNAEHVDIARGYAWIPWLILAMTPIFYSKLRIFAIPLGALIFWQAIVGIYPGITIAVAYIAVGVIAINLSKTTQHSRKKYLTNLGVTALICLLLCAPKFLPYLLLHGESAGAMMDVSAFNFLNVPTLIFGYGDPSIPGDISMRSYFIGAPILALLFFCNFKHRAVKLSIVLVAVALTLGSPWLPWFELTQNLPGLSLSRFTASDFKPFLILGLLLSAMTGLEVIEKTEQLTPKFQWTRTVLSAIAGSIVLVLGITLQASTSQFLIQSIIWLLTLAIFAVVAKKIPISELTRNIVTLVLICLVGASGIVWSFGTSKTWQINRIDAEISNFGAPVSELIKNGESTSRIDQRPNRLAPEFPTSIDTLSSGSWNGVAYSGKYALGGYVNVKGSTTRLLVEQSTQTPEGFAWLTSPGNVLFSDSEEMPSPKEFMDCVIQNTCGDGIAVPISYGPGEITFQITSETKSVIHLNEAFYPGWTAKLCDQNSKCVSAVPSQDAWGLMQVVVPGGTYQLNLTYVPKGIDIAWVMWWAGIALILCAVFSTGLLEIRRKRISQNESELQNSIQ